MARALPSTPVPDALKKEWRALWTGRRGERFERLYRRTQRTSGRNNPFPHLVRMALALVAFAAGSCALVLPVPVLPFFLICGALLAEESLPVARCLDRFELWLWRGWRTAKRRYGFTPSALRLASIIFAVGLTVLSGGLCYFALTR